MINFAQQSTAIPIAIEPDDRQQAFEFAQEQPTTSKADQVYRNTLAILVTRRYLQLLGIETSTDISHSWHPLNRVIENVADLYVPCLQNSLECRPIAGGDRQCLVPEEVQTDRLGYVFVQLDPPYQMGYLVGFVESVSVSELPLSYLRSLDELIGLFLDSSPEPVSLGQWLNNLFQPSWQPPSELLETMSQTIFQTTSLVRREDTLRKRIENLYRQQYPQQANTLPNTVNDSETLVNLIENTADDNIRWQLAELLWEINPTHPACPVITAKDLGLYLTGHNLALAIGILPKPDHTQLLLARVYPLGDSHHLPPGLKLTGSTEQGNPFFEIIARQQDNYIQFKFTAETGDRFRLQVTLDGATFTECFVV
ncbi:DUF1822 family protein [Nodularia harveyana UHCC-0300]|uniref:DUF1822 family protein n=1 Tax=Nodularia harveyana UHCC-0300 TaxID=2974287 RepID=A0ABU5UB59_9CYAN|nr:DUF1822 family protein [Nodularia harveyana]MEA5580765.1 DUF1822 family protein [Nodularia harveyana UHCC-0300]